MQAMDDMALLREYATRNSETAFEALVSRRVGFVYSARLSCSPAPSRRRTRSRASPTTLTHGLQREHPLRARNAGREASAPRDGLRRRHERGHLVHHTIYQLELPDTAPGTVAEGLQILSDYCGGLLLKQKMVDKERGIILSEERARDSVSYRTFVSELEFLTAGTRIPKRLPIGKTDVIEKASREQFVDFYNTWYRPDRMVVIVVGDIDGASVEKQIVDGFSGIAPRSPEPPAVDLGQVPVFTGLRANYHGEPEAPDTRIVLASTVPYTHEPDTAATRLKYLPRMLAVDMLNLRLGILAKKENAPFIRASASIDESFNLYREADIEVVCKASSGSSP